MRLATLGWGAGGLSAVVLVAALGWGLVHPAQAPPKTIVGQRAPDLTIKTLQDGTELRLGGFRGTPLVVNFWASWCVPCRQEAPVLNAAARQYAGRIQFVGVDIQDTVEAARSYQVEIQSPYAVGPASRGGHLEWGVAAPPETFFIDRQGTVISRIIGPVDARRLEIYMSQLRP